MADTQGDSLKLLNYTRIENVQKVLKKIFVFYYVAVIRTIPKVKNRYGRVRAITVNPLELPINDKARKEVHIANTSVRLYKHKKRNGKPVLHHKIS